MLSVTQKYNVDLYVTFEEVIALGLIIIITTTTTTTTTAIIIIIIIIIIVRSY